MIPEWAIKIAIGLYHLHADGRHSGSPTRDQIAAALVEVDRRAREECAKAIRKSCEVCGGSGYATYVNVKHGEDFPECEYCGRPIAVIRASTPDSGGKEVKGDGHT